MDLIQLFYSDPLLKFKQLINGFYYLLATRITTIHFVLYSPHNTKVLPIKSYAWVVEICLFFFFFLTLRSIHICLKFTFYSARYETF